jgi:drug/metabolite transporter (DMT)-like permease
MSASQWALLFVLSVLWGCSFLFTEMAIRELPILTIVALRVLIAGMVLLCLSHSTGYRMPIERRAMRAFLCMAS